MPSDAVAEQIAVFNGAAEDDEATRLDALAVLEELSDPRILPFFLKVLADPHALDLARIEICEILQGREGNTAIERREIARALTAVMLDDDQDDVRSYAAGALSSYLAERVAREAISQVVLDTAERRNVRHNALFAIERAGPSPESLKILRQLELDPELARAARRILGEWEPDPDGDPDRDTEADDED
jgi:hypothetical protein